jgi:hypothetical protein
MPDVIAFPSSKRGAKIASLRTRGGAARTHAVAMIEQSLVRMEHALQCLDVVTARMTDPSTKRRVQDEIVALHDLLIRARAEACRI